MVYAAKGGKHMSSALGTRKQATAALRSTAYHESAHAVVAFFSHVSFRRVTIVPGAGTLGHVVLARLPKWFLHSRDEFPDRSRIFAERRIVIAFAGQIAEARLAGSLPRDGMHADNADAVDFASSVLGDPEIVEAFLHYCWVRTESLVKLRWREIESVAAALLENETLSPNQVRLAISAA
jgi:ATP-dependent Zn protease